MLLTNIRCSPQGVEMILSIRARSLAVADQGLSSEFYDGPMMGRRGFDAEKLAKRFKWGIEFADGLRVTNLDDHTWFEQWDRDDPSWTPDRPVLHEGSGGASDRVADQHCWRWPLPPPGRLQIVCEWLAHDIPLTITELPGEQLHEAAQRARPLWPAGS